MPKDDIPDRDNLTKFQFFVLFFFYYFHFAADKGAVKKFNDTHRMLGLLIAVSITTLVLMLPLGIVETFELYWDVVLIKKPSPRGLECQQYIKWWDSNVQFLMPETKAKRKSQRKRTRPRLSNFQFNLNQSSRFEGLLGKSTGDVPRRVSERLPFSEHFAATFLNADWTWQCWPKPFAK